MNRLVLKAYVEEYGPFPDDYVGLDVETSGLDPNRDYVLQVGWCRVIDRKSVLTASSVIDWSATLNQDQQSTLTSRLEETRARMVDKGKNYPWTVAYLKQWGKSPKVVAERLAAAATPSEAFAGHYGWVIDFPMIGKLLGSYGKPFTPDINNLIDTGLLVKAALTDTYPHRGEPLPTYLKRVINVYPSPRHSLETCVKLFGLAESGADKKNAHLADYDTWLVYLILEQLRTML